MTPAAVVRRILFYGLITLLSLFFALPLLWLVLAPFDKTPTLTVKIPDFTLDNFAELGKNPYALVVAEELDPHLGRGDAAGHRAVRAGRIRALAGARARPRPHPLRPAAALVDRHRHGGDGPDLPADVPARAHRRPERRRPGAHRRPAAGGDLHPQGLHGRHAEVLRGERSGVRRQPAAGAAPRRPAHRATRPGDHRRVGARQRVGRLPHRRTSCCATRRRRPPACSCTPSTPRAGRRTSLSSRPSRWCTAIPVVALYLFVNRRYGFRFHGGIKS